MHDINVNLVLFSIVGRLQSAYGPGSSPEARVSSPSSSQHRTKRAATARTERLWDSGVIPYEIEANFSGKNL